MKSFFDSLSKATKVTLISCGCFVLLTMVILTFLMLCPVKKESNANHANDALMTATIQTQPSVTTAGEEAVQTTSRTRKTTDRNRKFKNRTTTTTIQTEEEQWYVEESSVDSGNDGWVDNNWQGNQTTNPYVEPSQSTPDYSEPDSSYTPSTPDSSLPDDSGSGSDNSQPDASLEDGGIE